MTLIEPGERLFAALQNPELSRSLEQLYRGRGINVILGDAVEAFHGGSGRLERATTRCRQTIDAQLAIVGIGVQPSTGYLDEALESARNGARSWSTNGSKRPSPAFTRSATSPISTTPSSDIDASSNTGRTQTTTANASAGILAGETAPYDQVAYFFTELAGTKIGLLGDLDAGHDRIISRGTLAEGLISYYLDDGHLVAALIVGQPPETQDQLERLLRDRARLEHLDTLTDPDAPIASAFTAGHGIPA